MAALVVLLVALAPSPPAAGTQTADAEGLADTGHAASVTVATGDGVASDLPLAAVCPAPSYVPGLGPTCPVGRDLYLVLARDGTPLALSHGPDPLWSTPGAPAGTAPGPEPGSEPATLDTEPPGRAPYCVDGAPGTRYIQLVYARASAHADDYADRAAAFVDLVARANGLVAAAATDTGWPGLNLRVRCDPDTNEPDVVNAALPTPPAMADFSTIKQDLMDQGHDDPLVKYLVYYDDQNACPGCGGAGEVRVDDRPEATNLHNGNAADPLYAVNFDQDGAFGVRVVLHELAHTLGAVQLTAPHTTGAFHCTDGLDVLCYDDGGQAGATYDDTVCADETFDCGRDDYCHADPAAGTYLATHWNVCAPTNAYLDPGTPTLAPPVCYGPTEPGDPLTCELTAHTDAAGVAFEVDWGDGSPLERVPAAGYVDPGTGQPVGHVFTEAGRFTITVQAVADSNPPTSSALGTTGARVLGPPVLETVSCESPVYINTEASCSMRATDPDSTGVRYEVSLDDGTTSWLVPATGYAPPGVSRSTAHAFGDVGTHELAVRAVDDTGRASQLVGRSIEVVDDAGPPTLRLLDPEPGTLYEGCDQALPLAPWAGRDLLPPMYLGTGCVVVHAEDHGSGVARVTVELNGREVGRLHAPNLGGTPAVGGWRFEFPVRETGANLPLVVVASDASGNVAHLDVAVIAAR